VNFVSQVFFQRIFYFCVNFALVLLHVHHSLQCLHRYNFVYFITDRLIILCRGAVQVMKQIEQNAQERLLDQERKDQESQQMLKYLEKLQMEDLRCC